MRGLDRAKPARSISKHCRALRCPRARKCDADSLSRAVCGQDWRRASYAVASISRGAQYHALGLSADAPAHGTKGGAAVGSRDRHSLMLPPPPGMPNLEAKTCDSDVWLCNSIGTSKQVSLRMTCDRDVRCPDRLPPAVTFPPQLYNNLPLLLQLNWLCRAHANNLMSAILGAWFGGTACRVQG